MKPEFISITKKEYEELLSNTRWMDCLYAAGVDNWEGFEYAQEMYRNENSTD